MKLYSYVLRYDTGFAPNPFWRFCTLATCKPTIRRIATEGDWIAGTGSMENVGTERLIYAMKITEVMPLVDYGSDSRFTCKIPRNIGKKEQRGDNIYYRDSKGETKQRFPSMHSNPHGENSERKTHDLEGKNVLISRLGDYYYFGREALRIPTALQCIIKNGPNHKSKFDRNTIDSFVQWIQLKKSGINADPCDY